MLCAMPWATAALHSIYNLLGRGSLYILSMPDTRLPTAVSLAMTYYCFLLIL